MDIIEEMEFHLGISQDRIRAIIEKKDKYYKNIKIPKKRGGTREVYLPNLEIKLMQRFIMEKYLMKIDVSNNAVAYIRGKSIKNNAVDHIGNSHFLFVDISNFFDNIDYMKMKKILKKALIDITERDLEILLKICTFDRKFVQGAITSPIISNIYLTNFDKMIFDKVNSLPNGKFTRYSDDITISSSNYIDSKLIVFIEKQLNKLDLNINKEKTYFSSYLERVEITGLIIRDNKIKLSNEYKRKVRNMIYCKLKYGKNSNESLNQVLGHLNYIKDVEPFYYNRLNTKYKRYNKLLIERLQKMQNEENSTPMV